MPFGRGVDARRVNGAGVGLESGIGSDGALPWFDMRVGSFGVSSVFVVPKNEC